MPRGVRKDGRCGRGVHPMEGANVRIRIEEGRKVRVCRACARDNSYRAYLRRKGGLAAPQVAPAPVVAPTPAPPADDAPACRDCGAPCTGGRAWGYGDTATDDWWANVCQACLDRKNAKYRALKAAGGGMPERGKIWRAKAIGSRRDDGQAADTA